MSDNPIRRTLWFGLFVYAALFVLSLVFYLERTVFADIAFHTVTLLKKKTLFIQNQRFVAALTQIFPLSAAKAGVSLKGVLMAYSAGFIVYYGAVFVLVTAWLRQWQMGLTLVLCSCLMVTDTFYWIQSELPQGLALLVLTLAFLLRYRSAEGFKGWQLGVLFTLWFTVAYAHPMLAFPLFFGLLFFWQKDPERALVHPKLLAASGMFVLLVLLLKNQVLGPSGYDAEAMGRVANLRRYFPNYFNLASNRDFLRWCLDAYYLLALAFFGNLAFYIWQKRWYKLLLFICFFLCYLLLVNVSIPDGFHRFYLENLYLPLAFFAALPLLFDLLPHFARPATAAGLPKWIFAGLVVCMALRIVHIGFAHRPWTARLDWERSFMAETATLPQPKLLVAESRVPMDKLLMSWGTSFEFMLLSSIESPDSTRLIAVDEDPSRLGWATKQPRSVITEWEVWEYDALPQRYFHPTDTSLYEIRSK